MVEGNQNETNINARKRYLKWYILITFALLPSRVRVNKVCVIWAQSVGRVKIKSLLFLVLWHSMVHFDNSTRSFSVISDSLA